LIDDTTKNAGQGPIILGVKYYFVGHLQVFLGGGGGKLNFF
jgi:hypothetical protein